MRLNPFAFPSDTTFRFLLLIAATIGVSLLAFDWVYSQFADLRTEALALLSCGEHLQLAPGDVPTDAALLAFRTCLASVNEARRTFVVGGVLVLLAGGVLASAFAIVRVRRRYGVLPHADARALAGAVESLAGELGVAPPPRLRWRPLDRRALGLASGSPRRRELAITGGLVPLFVRDPAAFRAIVLHELAHIRNGDVDLAYYAVGIWRALLVVAIAPFAIAVLGSIASDPAIVLGFGWRFAVLLPVVYAIRSGILRAREHDADVRASIHEPEIARVLGAGGGPEPGRVRSLFALHPSAARRVAVIADPSPLLRIGALDAFGIGLVGSLAYEEVALVLGYFGLEAFATRGLAGLAFGPLVGVILALGVWRQTFAFLAGGRHPVAVLRLGLALVAGLLVGQRLSLASAISDDVVLLRFDLAPFHVALAASLAAGGVLLVAWLVASARLWMPVAAGLARPTRAAVPVAAGAAALLAIGVGVVEIVVASREAIEVVATTPSDTYAAVRQVLPGVGPEWLWRLVLSPEVRLVMQEPLVLAFFVLVVVVPWAAVAWYPRSASPSVAASWGSIGPDPRPPAIERPALRPRQAIVAGVGGGVAIAAGTAVLLATTRAGLDASVRSRDEFLFALAFWLILVTLGGQALAGAVAAVRQPSFGVLHGVLAGLVAGVLGTLVEMIARTTTGCVPAFAPIAERPCGRLPTPDYAWAFLSSALTLGIVAAGLSAAIVVAGRRLLQMRRSPAAGSPVP
jgi:hypothetical protein